MQPVADKHPRGRVLPYQARGPILRYSGGGKLGRRAARQCCQRIGRAGKNRNGGGMKDFLPCLPARYLDKVIGADQPDETMVAMLATELPQRVDGVAGTEARLDVRHADARMPGDSLRVGHACRQGRHSRGWFQGILRRHEPPDFVQIQASQCFETDMAMPVMRRIERSPQQADTPGPAACPGCLSWCDAQGRAVR